MNHKKRLLCTLGPSSLNREVMVRLDELGVDIFRVNLSHTPLYQLEEIILQIQTYTKKPICIDTEGAQVRTGYVKDNSLFFEEKTKIFITQENIFRDDRQLSFNPSSFLEYLLPGDLISIDFESVLLLVQECHESFVITEVVSGGYVGSNKAVYVDRSIDLPFVSQKDREAIKISLTHGIYHFAMSFANSGEAVKAFRDLVGVEAFIISKIESKQGLKELDKILELSNAILIDRGDLSREVPIEKIPFIQKLIIQKANSYRVPVYIATNLLESMVRDKKPTRAEASDVINTLIDGADGLVLAAETAIGKYPIYCAVMISKLMKQYDDYTEGSSIEELQARDTYVLVEPHGAVLINRIIDPTLLQDIKIDHTLTLEETVLMDVEQIALGTFSPLQGFMNKEEIDSVLSDYRLPNGIVWTLPIFLQIPAEIYLELKPGQNLVLTSKKTAEAHAILFLEDKFSYDIEKMSALMFNTHDSNHPGVEALKKKGKFFISGKISLMRRLPSLYKSYEITPRQARVIFENRGWSRVVGFHTRNVPHRAHEYIQLCALEKYFCDGLFIHPIIGAKKSGDYCAEIILQSYRILMDKYYPKGKTMLAAFQNYSRYAGPREAVFTALSRKNFGCSHFILGRDHTGVGNYYQSDETQKLFESLGNIGIVPVFFNEVHYCKKCENYVEECQHGNDEHLSLCGTQAREILKANLHPPYYYMRPEVSHLLLKNLSNGKEIFVK